MNIGFAKLGGRAASVTGLLFLIALSNGAAIPGNLAVSRNVYVESNDATSNSLLVFGQNDDGTLTSQGSLATGGAGNGGGLGQGAIALDPNEGLLFAVNAGSNSISVFQTGPGGPSLLQTVPSQGTAPISVTCHNDIVYVLNSGGTMNVAGFRWDWTAGLQPIGGSIRQLSQASPGAKQVGIDPRGNALVVTEENTNLIDLFPLDSQGNIGSLSTFASAGASPFGFGFGLFDTLVVSNAAGGATDGSSASSYRYVTSGLDVVSAAIPTNQTAACWINVTRNGRFAYAADAGSSAITGYAVLPLGTLARLNANGLTASTDAHPVDMATSEGDRYLYVVASTGGALDEFRIAFNGSLTPIGSIQGLPTSISGIAAE